MNPENHPVLDVEELLDRVENDWELLSELVQSFIEDAPGKLANLQDALESRDCDALFKAAHAIKGSIANFSAREAIQTAKQIENRARDGRCDGADKLLARLRTETDVAIAALQALLEEHG